MKPLSIPLGIARGNAGNVVYLAPPAPISAEVRQEVLARDDHTCRCCGFRALRYQEILVLDRDPKNTTLGNLATTCQFCHQCADLEQVVAMKSGFLIWLPEIDQAMLSHMARALYVARVSQGPMADSARRLLDIVMTRREDVKRRLGTDDPFVLATVMRDFLNSKAYAGRDGKLKGVRLFPLDRRMVREGDLEFNQFPQILAYWRSKDGPFGGKLPTQWLEMFKDMMRATQAA